MQQPYTVFFFLARNVFIQGGSFNHFYGAMVKLFIPAPQKQLRVIPQAQFSPEGEPRRTDAPRFCMGQDNPSQEGLSNRINPLAKGVAPAIVLPP